MNNGTFILLPSIALTFMLLGLSSNSHANLFDDLGEDLGRATDLIKSVKEILPGKGNPPTTPAPTPQPNNQNTDTVNLRPKPEKPSPDINLNNSGNIILLSSPDNQTIKDIPLFSYKGLPALTAYGPKLTPDLSAEIHATGSVYANLMRMKFATMELNSIRLKENFSGGVFASPTKIGSTKQEGVNNVIDQHWYKLIAKLATDSLTDQSYTQYMCKKPCSHGELQKRRRLSNTIGRWGGILADQFEARRAFTSFIDDELNKYLAWAKQLDAEPEVYFIGKTMLSPYSFKKGGFYLRLNPVQTGPLPISENLKQHPAFNVEVENGNERIVSMHKGMAGKFVKVNDVEAEKIVARVQKKMLYYVYKSKLTIADKSYSDMFGDGGKHLNNHFSFDQTITSNKIEVFIGPPELNDKLFDIPL
ncbi:hypothetical protein A9Q88_02390 [Gammaproteobacteria bacterium 50_400_T64]|nr:hypothetical protein A9Q88_02390 [Gammaproteobacteria bacterium 50_400_T64]